MKSETETKMLLHHLPPELFLHIVTFLPSEKDINALTRTNKEIYDVLNGYLYQRNGKHRKRSSPLHWAAREGKPDTAKIAIREGYDPDTKDGMWATPLILAARHKHADVVRLLLDTGRVNVNAKDIGGASALSCVAENGCAEVARMLLEPRDGGELSRQMLSMAHAALHTAAWEGKAEVVKVLLATPGVVDFGFRLRMPLSRASLRGHDDIVRLLLESGKVDVNSKDSYRSTALHSAAKGGHVAVIKLLLSREEIEVNPRDNPDNRTPLSYAVGHGHEGAVKLLLDTGKAAVNWRDGSFGNTPLTMAVKKGFKGIVKLLLDCEGVDVNLTDEEGNTPLGLAAAGGHEGIVKLLLADERVDVNLHDANGNTPLSLATREVHQGIVKLIRDCGRLDETKAAIPGFGFLNLGT